VFQYPLDSFIDSELKTGRDINTLMAGRRLLYAATATVPSDFRLIEILFKHGADPLFRGRFRSPYALETRSLPDSTEYLRG
jgi:hypothetical protein